MNTEALERLRAFRQVIYTAFGCRLDALAELLDALLTSPVIEHPVHLSLAPGFQRTWGSISDALNAGTMPLPRLDQAVAAHPLETPTAWYAVDANLWPRNDAEISAERGYYYHRSPHSHDESIIAGWNSSWLVQLPERCSSWTAPLRVRRVQPGQNINQVAAEQIRSFLRQCGAEKPCPTFTFDAGYDVSPTWGGVGGGGGRGSPAPPRRSGPSTLIRPRDRLEDGRVGMGPSSPVSTQPPGPLLPLSGRPLMPTMGGTIPVLERAPSHSPPPPQTGHEASSPARPRDPHPTGGGASPQTDQSASAPLALVVGTGAAGSGNDLEGVYRPVLD